MGVILNLLPKTIILGDPNKNFSNIVPSTSGTSRDGITPIAPASSGQTRPSGGSTLMTGGAVSTPLAPGSSVTPPTTDPVVTDPSITDPALTGDMVGSGTMTFGSGGGGGGGSAEEPVAATEKSLEVAKKKSIVPWIVIIGAVLLIWMIAKKKKSA